MENKNVNEIRDFDDQKKIGEFLKIIKKMFSSWNFNKIESIELKGKTVIVIETDAYLDLGISLLKLDKFGIIKAKVIEVGSETDRFTIYDCDMDAFAKVCAHGWSNLYKLFPHPEGSNEYSVRKNVSIYDGSNVNLNTLVFKRSPSEIQSPEVLAKLMANKPRYWKDESELTERDLVLIEKYKQKHDPSYQSNNKMSETQTTPKFSSTVQVWDEIRQNTSDQAVPTPTSQMST